MAMLGFVHVNVVFLTNRTVQTFFYIMMMMVVMMVRVGQVLGQKEWSQRQAIGDSLLGGCDTRLSSSSSSSLLSMPTT